MGPGGTYDDRGQAPLQIFSLCKRANGHLAGSWDLGKWNTGQAHFGGRGIKREPRRPPSRASLNGVMLDGASQAAFTVAGGRRWTDEVFQGFQKVKMRHSNERARELRDASHPPASTAGTLCRRPRASPQLQCPALGREAKGLRGQGGGGAGGQRPPPGGGGRASALPHCARSAASCHPGPAHPPAAEGGT